jgi:GT2 family glycosyltransferase
MDVIALLPTLHRPDGLRLALQSLQQTAPHVLPVVSCDPDDHEAHRIADEFGAVHVTIQQPRAGCASAWNVALRAMPDRDVYVLASDDCEFMPGWLEAALEALEQMGGSGLVGFNDGRKPPKSLAVHYLMTRDFIAEHHGGVAAVPHYFAWGVDTEAIQRAQRVGKYVKCMSARVIHHWHGPDGDDTYRMGAAHRDETKAIYKQREAAGFPDDFERIIHAY